MQLINSLIQRMPYVKALRSQIAMQGRFPAGHYHSPIPSQREVRAHLDSRKTSPLELLDIDLRSTQQKQRLLEYADFYNEVPFPEHESDGYRYYYQNRYFSYSDAIFLYCFLRKQQPKRIIEVGSGFSSAVILDTVDHFFSCRSEITLIEPYPDRLNKLLTGDDRIHIQLIQKNVQEVSLDLFQSLAAGDLLFIDSSHVVKCGSDLQYLIFDVLPRLVSGVYVHFHDVFYPFDYPASWLLKGRYWNENYFLRAFLSYNRAWDIHFFNAYVHHAYGEVIKEAMPLCCRNTGGSLYIRRISN